MDIQKMIREYLRQTVTDEERMRACVPLSPEATRWEALLSVLKIYGEDVSNLPEKL